MKDILKVFGYTLLAMFGAVVVVALFRLGLIVVLELWRRVLGV